MENQKTKKPLSATLKKLFAVFLAVKNMLQKLSLILQPILNHSKLNQVNHPLNSVPTSWPQCQGRNLPSVLAPKMFRFWNSLFIKTFLWRPVLKRVRRLKPFFVEVTEISNKIAPHNKKLRHKSCWNVARRKKPLGFFSENNFEIICYGKD